MLAVHRIVLPTDFSACARRALDHGLFLAEDFGAELHLFHAAVWPQMDVAEPGHPLVSADEILDRVEAIGRSELGKLASVAGPGRLDIRQAQRRGYSAGVVILDYVEEVGADLIVMGSHGRRGAARFFLGSVTEDVVRHAPCPVLAVRGEGPVAPLAPPARVLAPVDFSIHSSAAVETAADLARRYGAALQLLHVLELPPLPTFYGPLPDAATIERMRELALGELRALAAAAGGEVAVDCHVGQGRAADEIARFAVERSSDLIVLPTHGRGGLDRVLLGSTTERLLRMASCPVLTLRPASSAD